METQHVGFFSHPGPRPECQKYTTWVISWLGRGEWHLWVQQPGERVTQLTGNRRRVAQCLRRIHREEV